jgi:hypothetical protein
MPMHSFAPIRFAVVASLAFSASLSAQSPQTKPSAIPQPASALPATPPTAPIVPPPLPLTPSQLPAKRAQVSYSNGTLSVSADNASLNQILREISTDTGMKITGGVVDERVFGHYGPDDPSLVLTALLDGTSSNMILLHRDGPVPAELILTPRQGGPTPPNPSAAAFDDKSERPEQPEAAPIRAAQPDPAPSPNSPPVTPATNGTQTGTSPNSSQPESPNGVKTPQQIYEQLQRMRQQQQQPQ